MGSYFSRREACMAAIGTFLGALSVGRVTRARPCITCTTDTETIETEPREDDRTPRDRNACLTYSFDRKGRLTSVVAPVNTSAQWSLSF